MLLVIEDDLVLAEALVKILEIHGYKVLTAQMVDFGLALALEFEPDLIITDYHLPGKSGVELAQALQAYSSTNQIPILLTTGMDVSQIGAYPDTLHLVPKPYDVPDLLAAIDVTMPRFHRQ
ncbi:MAG: response regulator [Bacteroidota bacterium]